MFQVALTVVSARIENRHTKAVVRDACTAFELQVPVGQRPAMEELLSKVFMDSKANNLLTNNVTSNFQCSSRLSKSSTSMNSRTML
jgi:hypothetical protein